MKTTIAIIFLAGLAACNSNKTAVSTNLAGRDKSTSKKYMFLDVHNLTPGKVKIKDVAGAHQKDLATEKEFDVSFEKYWVDEAKGKVYCLASSPDSASISETHKKAHGLIPDRVMMVTEGIAADLKPGTGLYLDVHRFAPGSVTDKDVAAAHVKDLSVQDQFHVSFVNYWVDARQGIVMCLANAPDSAAMVNAHKEAHGLIPDEVHHVAQGN